ncbi:hypothetical protein [Phocaeicola vulgatus]|jgi:hypothetical protein|uniref:hypothetical protein n=1 Tax=Phocaeicola vulgatus TaxID=821 RepID=UPI001E2A66E5|nr:hypothetical protein [Phocaeicola vulgatus]
MKFKENVQKILQKLGFAGSEESLKALTPDEWKQFFASYHEEFGTDFHADMQAYQDEQRAVPDQAQINEAFSVLSGLINPKQNVEDAAAHGVQDTKTEQPTAQQVLDMAKAVSATFMAMGNHAADDVPMTTVAGSVVGFTGSGDREKFLFGIEHDFFSMDKPWNRFTANPTSDQRLGDKKIAASFGAEVEAYSSSLAERYSYLQSHNQLNPEKLAAGEFATDYSQVTGMNGGDQYLIRRQDAIIARVLSIRQLTQYFPVRYGIQDRDVIFNAFFGEVSQAYQVGEVYKGDMEIEPEMGYVDDAMIKMKFGPMKELERMYIGYLNREGSDPIKWSMIEYAIMGSLENAQREQNMRRMRGLYVKPETGVAGSYLNAGTGVLYTLIRLHHEHKLLLTDNVAYRTYDDANMLETVQEFYKEILAKVSEDMSLDQHVMYLNENHKQWWIQNVREAYGQQQDFTGPNSYLNIIPDSSTNMRIIWLPYLGQLPFMMMQVPGNIQFLENLPGEMLAMQTEMQMEMVRGWSTWKEGCSPAFVGRNFSSADKLKENDYLWQQIFLNKPSVTLDADATTADASKGFWFISGTNTGEKKLTAINKAKKGVAYIVECGNKTNVTGIDKAGSFDSISEAWTPTAVGDYIMVMLNSQNKFIELERCIGGVRKVNKTAQPNVPGAR